MLEISSSADDRCKLLDYYLDSSKSCYSTDGLIMCAGPGVIFYPLSQEPNRLSLKTCRLVRATPVKLFEMEGTQLKCDIEQDGVSPDKRCIILRLWVFARGRVVRKHVEHKTGKIWVSSSANTSGDCNAGCIFALQCFIS